MHAYYFLKIVKVSGTLPAAGRQVQCITPAVRSELVTKVQRLQKKFKKNHKGT